MEGNMPGSDRCQMYFLWLSSLWRKTPAAATHVHQLISIFSLCLAHLKYVNHLLCVILVCIMCVSGIFLSVSSVEGMKVVEIEKCRSDIKKLREEMASRNNRSVTSLPFFIGDVGTAFLSWIKAQFKYQEISVAPCDWFYICNLIPSKTGYLVRKKCRSRLDFILQEIILLWKVTWTQVVGRVGVKIWVSRWCICLI